MVVEGFESWPDPLFSKPDDWDAYEAMTGCQQAAYKARLCYSAMLQAAPSPSMSHALSPEWLWCEFMDYCRKRGVAPANMNDLFEIVKRARTMLTAPPPASTNRLTDEQIAALRIAADALIEKYAEPIREILRNAEQP